ncbi:MAG: hypothetical protein COV44_07935 [Deltaproteobacteria bacterium CG11_big_fil_rev_8_21_14_0_20_45_16]|nr:MAG: hypothetical protein COV44_07935 [Deltaproteobacteria bacterium CG11_big_fil_rev_8_21_14_0_20_45_16]
MKEITLNRLNPVEESIDECLKAVKKKEDEYPELSEVVRDLKTKADRLKAAVNGNPSSSEARDALLDAEQAADSAKQAVMASSEKIDPNIRQSVLDAHQKMADLKHEFLAA